MNEIYTQNQNFEYLDKFDADKIQLWSNEVFVLWVKVKKE